MAIYEMLCPFSISKRKVPPRYFHPNTRKPRVLGAPVARR
jgi:hypothetical protein